MDARNEKARNLLAQEPGRDVCHEEAANTPNIATAQPKRQKAGASYWVTPTTGDPFPIVVKGRDHWALDRLRRAGCHGCTPVDDPAPRWSAYVFNLRALGLEIETIHERHGGQFAGTHGRYVLHSTVTPIEREDAA